MEVIADSKSHADSSLLLSSAVENSELLLNFATETGLDIREDWVETLIAAKQCNEKNVWDNEIEIKFWMAYKNLSKMVQPVSIDSLRATKIRKITRPNLFQKIFKIKLKSSFSKRSVQRYLTLTSFWIVVMLIVQVFTLKGNTLLNTIQMSNKRITEIDFRIGEVKLLIKADETNERAVLERYRLESEKGKLDDEKRGSIELLKPWVYTIRKLTSLNRLLGKKQTKEDSDAEENAVIQQISGPGGGPPGSNDAATSQKVEYINVVQEAQNFTQILQLYILPLLYGLIGGFVFVLRGLVPDIKNRVFSQFSNIKYSLRIHLGAIAGLIVGLLWGDIENQQISFLESLSTAGFAFIAGYGIEYLFNGIDRLIGTLGMNLDASKKDK